MGEAIGAVTKAKRASAANYLIAHRDEMVIDIEAAPEDFNLIYPENDIITHTNHFKVFHQNIKDYIPSLWPDTFIREYRASEIMKAHHGKVTIKTIKKLLRDHFDYPTSICTHRSENVDFLESEQTNASVIMNLKEKIFFVAKGPPCKNNYAEVVF
jgi:isopenicillin-N N-acyltransferase-like protein